MSTTRSATGCPGVSTHIVAGYACFDEARVQTSRCPCTEDPAFGQEHSRPVTELPVVINQNLVYINGQFVDAITAERIDVIDPATSDVIARVPKALKERFRNQFRVLLKCGSCLR